MTFWRVFMSLLAGLGLTAAMLHGQAMWDQMDHAHVDQRAIARQAERITTLTRDRDQARAEVAQLEATTLAHARAADRDTQLEWAGAHCTRVPWR